MSETTLNQKEYIQLKYEMFLYALELPTGFNKLSDEFMRKCYNGAGSDTTPQFIRYLLTVLLSPCKTAVLVHDVDFTTHNCTFEHANDKFVENCQKLIDAKYSKYSIFRRLHYGTLKLISKRFISAFGDKWEGKNNGFST